MAQSFADLKKSRKTQFDRLNDQLDKMNKGYHNPDDDKFWSLTLDKAGTGSAVLRFLPEPMGEDLAFIPMYNHGFKGPTGKWYIENSLTTIRKNDPVSEYNTERWNTGIEAEQDAIRKYRKRRLKFISNVYIVDDPANPENNGKVFLFRYGKKIHDMLMNAAKPKFAEDPKIFAFDVLDEGANFYLRAFKNEDSGFTDYSNSKFGPQKSMTDKDGKELSESEIEEIWKSAYSLQDLLAPEKFKSYDELKKRLYEVLGIKDSAASAPTTNSTGNARDDLEDDYIPDFKEREAKPMAESKPQESSNTDDDGDDEFGLDFFKSLADE